MHYPMPKEEGTVGAMHVAMSRWNAGCGAWSPEIYKRGRNLLMFLVALAATHALGFTPDFDSLLDPLSRAFWLIMSGLGRLRQ